MSHKVDISAKHKESEHRDEEQFLQTDESGLFFMYFVDQELEPLASVSASEREWRTPNVLTNYFESVDWLTDAVVNDLQRKARP